MSNWIDSLFSRVSMHGCLLVNKPVIFKSEIKYLQWSFNGPSSPYYVDVPFCVERNASYRRCMVQRLATFSKLISVYFVNLAEPVNTFCRRLRLDVGSPVTVPAAVR